MKKLFLLLAVVALGFTACDKENGNSNIPKVGTLVTKDGVKGVVFYADDNVTKIVSVEQTALAWSTVYEQTDAADMNDGSKNMEKVQNMEKWETNYPAFKWCAEYGQGWYLPAYTELEQIYANREAINAALSAKGYKTLVLEHTGPTKSWYWSSTECSAPYVGAYGCPFANGDTIGCGKEAALYVRAVLAY